MKRNIMGKNLRQSVRRSLERYLAILAIIALGASFFAGLQATKMDMVETGQRFMDGQNMFDLRLLSTYGWTQKELDAISHMEGVQEAEGVISMDVIARVGQREESVYQLYSIPEKIDKVYLLGGRMPEAPNECLADGIRASDGILGTTVSISDENEKTTLDALRYDTYTVVGYVSSTLFMDISRGNTTLGNGSVAAFLYLPAEAFDVDYYTQISVRIPGSHTIYTDAFDDAMDSAADALEPLLRPLADARYGQVRTDAETKYADGLNAYQDGLAEYLDGEEQVLQELEDALHTLLDGQREIEENQKTLDDGQEELDKAQALLDESDRLLADSAQTLAKSKADAYAQLADASATLVGNYKAVSENLRAVEEGLTQLADGLTQLETGIGLLESGISQLDTGISVLDTLIRAMDTSVQAAQSALDAARENGSLSDEVLAELEAHLNRLLETKEGYVRQRGALIADREDYLRQLADLKQQREDLQCRRKGLVETRNTLNAALDQLNDGFLELQSQQLQADNEFAAAEAKLEGSRRQLDEAQETLDSKAKELEEGRTALEKARQELEKGWAEYWQGKDEAQRELSDARLELLKAKLELDDARATIDGFTDPEVYILDRNTNVGYLALDNNSDIVAGISRVFPVFFLLVAALVCITTMTRMVEEERTQIGTLKALGYSNGAIISKYLIYAGSAAVLGCGFGVIVGSIVFPNVLWSAYRLILSLTPELTILFNIPLCIGVVLVNTAVTLLVTWNCCRLALREVPAELIRPKAPTSGKKIFLEYLPFWKHVGFLNKVMLRNIFRYRQRLMMMLLGIGGCAALLVTGFGIGDSIKNIVTYQFEEVTLYDIQVQFTSGRDAYAQSHIQDALSHEVASLGFAHQSGVDLEYDGTVQSLFMIVPDDTIAQFFDFHSGSRNLPLPEQNEVLISAGVAEKMGIRAGESVKLRNADMKTLSLTVSGVFDNHVYNYAIVRPETVEAQWGLTPEYQMAYIRTGEDRDPYRVSTKVSELPDVMQVSVSRALADQVSSMMEAMDMVVVTVVICAGLLAVIVLYNLTNINITERIREIATIKVLGFTAGESAAYVFKENLLLSAMGALLGLGGGKLLLDFVMSQIRIDMVWFQSRVTALSLVLSVLVTILMACLVDFLLYFKLERINMAEALKSVE